MAKPAPVSKVVVCSVCGLPWEDHTKGRKTAPTADVCIRLLKAEIAKRPRFLHGTGAYSSGAVTFAQNVTPITSALG